MTPATTTEDAENLLGLPVKLSEKAPAELKRMLGKAQLHIAESWLDPQYGHVVQVAVLGEYVGPLKADEVETSLNKLH